jgi:hypothetical protein
MPDPVFELQRNAVTPVTLKEKSINAAVLYSRCGRGLKIAHHLTVFNRPSSRVRNFWENSALLCVTYGRGQVDTTTKLLLAAIAAGLFASAGAGMVRPADAQLGGCSSFSSEPWCVMARDIHKIEDHLDDLTRGLCLNSKPC